ncbi:hypothetical protein HJ590_13235 [Naumannella sp. ID2617S]|nr:hypothetical protein [Naumannella sp. ID2617S]
MDRIHHQWLTHPTPNPLPWHARPNTCLNCGWHTWYATPLTPGWDPTRPGRRIQVDPTPISPTTAATLDRPVHHLAHALTDREHFVLRPHNQPPLNDTHPPGDLLPEHVCHQPETTPTIPSNLKERTR